MVNYYKVTHRDEPGLLCIRDNELNFRATESNGGGNNWLWENIEKVTAGKPKTGKMCKLRVTLRDADSSKLFFYFENREEQISAKTIMNAHLAATAKPYLTEKQPVKSAPTPPMLTSGHSSSASIMTMTSTSGQISSSEHEDPLRHDPVDKTEEKTPLILSDLLARLQGQADRLQKLEDAAKVQDLEEGPDPEWTLLRNYPGIATTAIQQVRSMDLKEKFSLETSFLIAVVALLVQGTFVGLYGYFESQKCFPTTALIDGDMKFDIYEEFYGKPKKQYLCSTVSCDSRLFFHSVIF